MTSRRASSQTEDPRLTLAVGRAGITLGSPAGRAADWAAVTQLAVDGKLRCGRLAESAHAGADWRLVWRSATRPSSAAEPGARGVAGCAASRSSPTPAGRRPLERVDLLSLSGVRNARFDLGRAWPRSACWNRTRTPAGALGRPDPDRHDNRRSLADAGSFSSSLVALLYSPADERALLIGFESFDRWLGQVRGGSVRAREQLQGVRQRR